MLVHSSIAELQELGLHERYCSLVPSTSLERINALLGPGWMPIELVLDHYSACDRLGLSDELILECGQRAGENMGRALLVAGATHDADGSPWAFVGAYSRMGRRIHEGGSAQYVKIRPNTLQIEHYHNPLFSFHYYRVGHGGFLRKSLSSLGVKVKELVFTRYRGENEQIEVQISW
jgi:hypothetical protein